MPIVMRFPTLLGIVVILGVCQRVGGQDSPLKQNAALNYEKLIAQLVSPNNPPMTHIGSDSSVKFPSDYNVEAQKRIEAVRQMLHADIENALPFLVGALDDKRYCMTINWADGDGYYNYSVGSTCKDVIASHLEVYRDAIWFSGPAHWHRYNYPISKDWWEKRRGRRLPELQVEVIDWAIERRKAEPKDSIREGREAEVAELQRLREVIAKSGKPAAGSRTLRMVTRDIGKWPENLIEKPSVR